MSKGRVHQNNHDLQRKSSTPLPRGSLPLDTRNRIGTEVSNRSRLSKGKWWQVVARYLLDCTFFSFSIPGRRAKSKKPMPAHMGK